MNDEDDGSLSPSEAAHIEMMADFESGECIVIDEEADHKGRYSLVYAGKTLGYADDFHGCLACARVWMIDHGIFLNTYSVNERGNVAMWVFDGDDGWQILYGWV